MAHGAGQIQEAKPGGRQVVVEITFHLNQPVTIVAVKAIRLEKMRGVFQGTKFPAAVQQLVILLGFLALPNTLFAVGVIAIIMILVNSANNWRGINHGSARIAREPK